MVRRLGSAEKCLDRFALLTQVAVGESRQRASAAVLPRL
jgi:hypothetical protein